MNREEKHMIKKIGFIGLGIMGKPMATNLIKAGYQLTVHDVNRKPVQELVAMGAGESLSPKGASVSAYAVFTSLPNDQIVGEVATGKGGIIEGMNKGAIVVDMSTISPTTTKIIAERLEQDGMEMLDAPVSGGEVGAIEATLAIMVGGKEEVFNQLLPVLQKLGKNVNHVGDHGAGQVAKAANNIVVGLNIEAVAEALVFAKKAGVDPEKVRNALLGGFAHSRVLELHGQRMLDRNFKPGGKVFSHKKDIEIAIAVANELGIYLPATALLSHLWNAIVAHGGIEWDHSSIVKVLELMSNTEVRPG
ncbi:MAG: 2-hydroxy-3-oxopropionate reductase [Desulfobacteraceae bacterium]|nr:2-hydroxy-3-oxopropionate reductase [Desulfobacteraceae bacterium]